MRKILMRLAILVLFYNSADAGLFKDNVDLADLSQLSQEALETLKDPAFRVFLMKVKHAGAQVLEKNAKENLKTAKLTFNAKKQHVKSAEADLKEAKATQNLMLMDVSEKALRQAKTELDHTLLLVKWKEKDVDAQVASVKKAQLAVSVAECESDLARVSKLKEQNVPSAEKYAVSDFKKRLEEKQKEYDKAVSTEMKETAESKKRKEAYQKSSK